MSKKKRRQKRDVISIDAIGNAVDQGLLRSAATMGQQLMEHVLKTDPKIKLLLERLVKQRLERVLEKLADNKNDEGV
jgi:hypothetical protein